MTILAAYEQLVELAREMRPDWNAADFEGAVNAARHAGWPFGRTAREAFRLLLDPAAAPRELRHAARDYRPPEDGATERGVALARHTLGLDGQEEAPDARP